MPGNSYDGHTLGEALEQAAILCDAMPEVVIVDRGYKDVAAGGATIYQPGLQRGITRGLRTMIRRRDAIEPAIGHMKTNGKLDTNWLRSAVRRRPRPQDDPEEPAAFCVFILAAFLNRCIAEVMA